jgi:branched-chain amino acid transport system ATP-binding protein
MVGGPEATVAPRAASPSSSGQPDSGAQPRDGEVLALEDVAVRFGGISALSGVSLSVPEGIVLGLIGPNGAGKTTLFDVISGVRAPNGGRVWFRGRDVTRASAVARSRRGLRRTFQRVQTFGWLTVEDNVLAALEWRGGGGGMFADVVRLPTRRSRERDRRARVTEVLEQCGLTAVRSDPVGSLPIGVARMVEFARAIVDEPKLLLLDEPTSGLDEREAERLIEQLALLRATTTCSVMLVEHDMSFVMEQCDTVVVLELGQVIATGTPQEIQQNPQVRAAYLGDGSNNRNNGNTELQGGQS